MAIGPTTTYGVRIRVTPDTSGNNSVKAQTVLYRSPTALGTKTRLASKTGTSVWYYDDERNNNDGTKYYHVRTEMFGMTSSSYVGPVDAEPTDLEAPN